VLQARVKDYQPGMLTELLYEDRHLVDGWDKVASIYQTTDWPFFARHRERMGAYHHLRSEEVTEIAPEILAAVDEHGPISSLHFKGYPKTDWFWSSTSLPRAALETLYAAGTLGISQRVNTRRDFDLIERLVPENILSQSDPNPVEDDYHAWHVLRRISSMGLASPAGGEHWQGIHNLRKADQRRGVLSVLSEAGDIIPIEIESIEGQIFYLRSADLPALKSIDEEPAVHAEASFIAPLDNLIWNRKMITDLFDFKYVWEVYKPKNKRDYGYYVLPVIFGDEFIARVDMKFHRKTNQLEILNWWWQKGHKPDDDNTPAVARCFADFKRYLGTGQSAVAPEAKNKTFLKKVNR
ncbi:MAG: crosslink repair DNA glycosylase YcaQ family protein, partial [Chloroflexota bacterium]